MKITPGGWVNYTTFQTLVLKIANWAVVAPVEPLTKPPGNKVPSGWNPKAFQRDWFDVKCKIACRKITSHPRARPNREQLHHISLRRGPPLDISQCKRQQKFEMLRSTPQ